MVEGYQGRGLGDPEGILATAKHFAGYSETLGGRDASEAELSRRKLLSTFLPPFERVARGGAMAFMTGYQSIDGVPSTANRWLLTEVLKEQWGFEGILVTDWYNVGHLVHDQKICADFAEAATTAIRAGNDLMMATPEFYDGCLEALGRGLLAEAEVDTVVRRVLGLKFRMGLFEEPGFGNPERLTRVIGCPDHRAVALRAARESLVLLRNDLFGIPVLPFHPELPRKIAVIGPNADNPLAQLGDWSLGSGQMVGPSGTDHPRSTVVTIRDGIIKRLPPGWALTSREEADVIIVVVGDQLSHIGEGKSTATLELQGGQQELVDEVAGSGKLWVGVLVNSKPLVLPRSLLEAPALLEAFNPGMEGGTAVAEALFGDLNPSGKLTISFPRHAGQLPVFYNAVRGQHGDRYADLTQEPAFSFGFGLGYSPLALGSPTLVPPRISREGEAEISLTVTNRGGRGGIEVVQVYVEDEVTSATWARRELKAWARVAVPAQGQRTVTLHLQAKDLWIVDSVGRKVVEPGRFRVLVGTSSRDADLQELWLTVE
jgi:beta-glucosidase